MTDGLQRRIQQHQLLKQLRIKLLRLHKTLLDIESAAYEQMQGHVSRGELLQLVIHHEQFAWLHQLSQRIVKIDDLAYSDEPVTAEAIAALVSDIRQLLSPADFKDDFAMKYEAALQQYPDVVMAHAEVVPLLAA